MKSYKSKFKNFLFLMKLHVKLLYIIVCMAAAEFSVFAGILSAALSQHHLLQFEIAQLEFHHLC